MPLPEQIQDWKTKEFTNLKILIYGDIGVGKTVFASTAPKPLFADVEDGMMSIQIDGVKYWTIKKWADLRELVKFLQSGENPFKTIVIDPLYEVQKVAMDNVITSYPKRREYETQPAPGDWGKSLDDFEHFIRALRSLPMNVILLNNTSGAMSTSERIEPGLQGKNSVQMVCRYMDVVGYMYTETTDEGKMSRRIAFHSAEALTKDRTWRLPNTLPAPTWAKLEKYLVSAERNTDNG